ncbi:MAG: hypothetical protein RLZZ591_30 [Pseudomonadota bacterium]|jgi:hypothetical protein
MNPVWACPQTSNDSEVGSRSELRLSLSNYTRHFKLSDSHKPVIAIGLERRGSDDKLEGLSLFTNSFGQPSAYLYPWGGEVWGTGRWAGGFAKWTAGLLYGYQPPYDHKVPLNYRGLSPAAVVAVGAKLSHRSAVQINLLGDAGLMVQVYVRLD